MPTKKQNKAEQIVGKIFRDTETLYGLKEFEGFDFREALEITEEEPDRFFVTDIKSKKKRFVWDEKKQSGKPEEIVRQLWLYKLRTEYHYPLELMHTEHSVHFGREIHAKAVDIVVFKRDGTTPYILVETKKPKESQGIEQLKSYLNAEGAEIGLWSNGKKRVILYRPYPREFDDTLPDLPSSGQSIDDLFDEKKTLDDYTDRNANLKDIVESMEELVLANAGVDVFSEVFKLVYAKLYDESEARVRPDHEVHFRKYRDPAKTYQVINGLFKEAIKKWPGIFHPTERVNLSQEHLSVVVGELERARLFGSDLSIVDEAFEYLIPEVAKGKKGQYFTPRHVIAMAVKILDPKRDEYVMDPASGSGGFLIGAMYHARNTHLGGSDEGMREYAKEHVWGIDFADEVSKVSRALMLIAGDGRSHMFKLNSLDPREWKGEEQDMLHARSELQKRLLAMDTAQDTTENRATFRYMDFDLILTNPPFAGEIKDQGMLRQYFFGKKKGKIVNKIERHILFIERTLDMLRPGGRMAIVLPQGVLNNTNMEYVREYLFDKARILAVVGLHGNTFKPHTGTKTSVLFLQKWGREAGEPQADYPIFTAVSKRAGKDNSGDYVHKKDEHGNYSHDARGRKVLDHDLDDIADGFLKFAGDEKVNF